MSSSNLISLVLLILIFALNSCKTRPSTFNLNKGIEFLIKSQSKDGSWDPNNFDGNYKSDEGIIALTAISLAALLKQKKVEIKSANLALQFLLKNQKKSGQISNQNYANAISLYALSIANQKGLINDEPLIKLSKYLIEQQSSTGAWDYKQANAYRNDLSITGWVFLGINQTNQNIEKQIATKESLSKLNEMLEADKSGVGNEDITAKAKSYYTYGKNPNGPDGKISRESGTTIQAITLMIYANNASNHLNQWVQKAIEDQIKSYREDQPYSLYKAFFNFNTNLPNNKKSNNWLHQIKTQIKSQQSTDGSWLPNDHPTKFGGTVFSTALSLLILTD